MVSLKLKHRVIALMFTALFVNYYCGITLFTHTHVVNKVVIVHSHPFSNSGHAHTQQVISLLSLLSQFIALGVVAGCVLVALRHFEFKLKVRQVLNNWRNINLNVDFRAPPVTI